MKRAAALPYVSVCLDDSLNVLGPDETRPDARLVGWQCGFEPLFIAVQSYLPGVVLEDDEAVALARDYLVERGWFSEEPTEPDYII